MEASSFAGGPAGAAISTALVTFYAQHLGRGPTRARTYISDDVVVCVMQDAGTTQERALHEAGRGEVVRDIRGLIRRHYADELASIVEEAVGRRVVCALGDFEPQHEVVALVFPLEPQIEERQGFGE